jgi:dihydrodipicolinate synthase/N-acetylneuraminate lyase
MPLIVGCAAQSTRETVLLCQQAAAAGGDYALVLPPAYYKASYDRQALISYFTTVADKSPIPLLLYNYPGAASGTDLDSDFLIELAAHPNVSGAKLTCGNVGKLARLAAATSAITPTSPKRKSSLSSTSQPFVVLAGSADFLLPALAVNGSGTLAGLANIVPKSCVELMNAYKEGETFKARELQAVLARADWAVQKGGVVGTKYALQHAFGYGGFARAPLPRWSAKEIRANSDALEEAIELEREL